VPSCVQPNYSINSIGGPTPHKAENNELPSRNVVERNEIVMRKDLFDLTA